MKVGDTVYHKLNGQKMIIIEMTMIVPPRAICRYSKDWILDEKEFLIEELSCVNENYVKG
jgi:hypothetical protein